MDNHSISVNILFFVFVIFAVVKVLAWFVSDHALSFVVFVFSSMVLPLSKQCVEMHTHPLLAIIRWFRFWFCCAWGQCSLFCLHFFHFNDYALNSIIFCLTQKQKRSDQLP